MQSEFKVSLERISVHADKIKELDRQIFELNMLRLDRHMDLKRSLMKDPTILEGVLHLIPLKTLTSAIHKMNRTAS